MLIGILPDASHVETLLNNLSEADFDLARVSLLMSDLKQRDLIANDTGPMKGWSPINLESDLIKKGLPQQKIQYCVESVGKGKVLFAMDVSAESLAAAREMLKDHAGEIIQE
jgi:hypothetical protein